jgi:hypothetical protein
MKLQEVHDKSTALPFQVTSRGRNKLYMRVLLEEEKDVDWC